MAPSSYPLRLWQKIPRANGSKNAVRVVSVIAATVIALACGTNYAYSAWAPQFASRLKLSSTEINIIWGCSSTIKGRGRLCFLDQFVWELATIPFVEPTSTVSAPSGSCP